MTTTKTRPSTELTKLIKKREKTHAAAREIKKARADHEAKTAEMRADFTNYRLANPEEFTGGDFRPKPGSEADKLSAAIRERERLPNPHQDSYGAAVAAFHVDDAAVSSFQRQRLPDLIAELDPEFRAAEDAIRAGLESLLDGAEKYASLTEEVRGTIVRTPGITGQALTHDPRPGEWLTIARQALDSDLARPGLTESAAWSLGNNA